MQAFTTKSFSSLIRARLTEFFPRQNYATRKRFYRNTGIVQSDSKWEVTLDHRRLKTPNGRVLSVSSEPLARAIAAEWDAQLEHITLPTMHLSDSKWEVTLDHRRLKTPNGRVLSVSREPLARAIAAEWDAQLEHITLPTMHLSDSKWEVTLDHRRLKTPNGRVLSVSREPLARAIAAEWDAQLEHITLPTMHLSDSKWEVTLDHRRLKTPNGRVLSVSSEPLARAIAAEWDAQLEHITLPTMHLTALCNTAIDNPGKLTSHDIGSYLLDFIPTDTLLFHTEEEEELRALQEKKWTPVLEWYQKRFNVTQETSKDLVLPAVATETRAMLARYFLSFDFPALNAICFGVEALKSPILMIACIERHLEPTEAVLLSRLEEEYQLSRWGRVPWAHELNQAEMSARVAAALLVVAGAGESHSARAKSTPPETA